MEEWVEKRILVLGLTYPHYSTKYGENVCTGAIEEDTGRMIRIHPVPKSYLEADHQFRSFQWLNVRMKDHAADPRPESKKIDPKSIEPGEQIPSTRPDERRRWLERSPHMAKSVEDVKLRNERDSTSLGIIQPKEILGVRLAVRGEDERHEWQEKEDALMRQGDFFERPPMKIDFPEVEFMVRFRCDDPSCNTHDMGLKQWGIHELYRKLRGDPRRNEKVVAKMEQELDPSKRDIYFFLGNFRGRMYQFGLMDSYSPAQQNQLGLF